MSQGMEMATNNAKDIQSGQIGSPSQAVQHVKREAVKPARRVECFRCGGAHYANDCKFQEAVCHACNKKGHLAKKCRSVENKAKNEKWKAQQNQAPTHYLEGDEGDAACAFNMFAVDTNEEPSMPYYATVTVEGKDKIGRT